MRSRTLLAAAVAAVAISSSTALAQRAATSIRPVASYIVASRHSPNALPAQVSIADSAGTLIASYWVEGQSAPAPMTVTVERTDIVLRAQTSRGPLMLVLTRQNEGTDRSRFTGRWSLGSERGTLKGHTAS